MNTKCQSEAAQQLSLKSFPEIRFIPRLFSKGMRVAYRSECERVNKTNTPIFLIPIVTIKHVKLMISILGVVETDKYLAYRSIFWKVYEEEMLIRTLATTLLEIIFCTIILRLRYLQKNVRSGMINAWDSNIYIYIYIYIYKYIYIYIYLYIYIYYIYYIYYSIYIYRYTIYIL